MMREFHPEDICSASALYRRFDKTMISLQKLFLGWYWCLLGCLTSAAAEPQAECFGFSDPDLPAKHFIRIKSKSSDIVVCCKTAQSSKLNHTKVQAFCPLIKVSQLDHNATGAHQRLLFTLVVESNLSSLLGVDDYFLTRFNQ